MEESRESVGGPVALANAAVIRALLIGAARAGQVFGYADLLGALGYRFTRPKMRALCRTLDAIDEQAREAGEPELAVLVVRESDKLPGQGWWAGERARLRGYDGPWTGPEALGFVRALQAEAVAYWSCPGSGAVETDAEEAGSAAQM